VLAAASTIDDRPAQSEMRVVNRFGTTGGDRLQPLVVEIGPGRLTVPVERVEEADMRWDERRREVDPVWWSASGFSEEASP